MPPDEIDAATFYNSGGLGTSRVIRNLHDLSEFMSSVRALPAAQTNPYFDGNAPESYWNGFSEYNFREIAHILYLENAPEYREHLNYIFDYGRSYYTWRDLWDNHRLTMVEIRNIVYNTISNMTVSQAGDMVRIISRALENIVGLNSYSIDFLARWANSLYMVYGDGSVAFPLVENNYYEPSINERLQTRYPGLMRYIESSTEQYSHMTFDTLDARLLYLSNASRTIALAARTVAHSSVFSEEEKEYIRYLLERMDISADRLYNIMSTDTSLGTPEEIREFAELQYQGRMWAPYENAFLASIPPYDYEVNVDPVEGDDAVRVSITTPSGTPLEINLAPPNDMLTTLNSRRALINIARNLNISFPENLSDEEVEIFMRNYTAPGVFTDEVITVPLPAGYADSVRRGDYEHSLGVTGAYTAINSVAGFTGSNTAVGMTGGEVALNTQGVCNLNDLANAHAYNKNPKVEFEKIKVPSEQEIWEGLQKNHAGMMETIQYILDDCTIDYKEKDKTKRIDKMEKEMLPRIKGVLTCMDDRLIPEEKRYINLWLSELIQFAIDCNNPVPYRKLAPGIRLWNQKDDPRQKKPRQLLHIIPRLSE
jgi:hypothetical protein